MRMGKSRFRRALLFALLSSSSSLALSVILSPPPENDWQACSPRLSQRNARPLDGTVRGNASAAHDWLMQEKNIHGKVYEVILLGGSHNTERKHAEKLQPPGLGHICAFDMHCRLSRLHGGVFFRPTYRSEAFTGQCRNITATHNMRGTHVTFPTYSAPAL